MSLNQSDENFISKLKWKTIYQGECWTYYYGLNHYGYPRVTYKGRRVLLNRLIAHLYYGMDLDSPKLACHETICKFKNCWRPEHIYVGDFKSNMEDQIKKGLHWSGYASYQSNKTHCPRGHLLPETMSGEYGRRCKICYPSGHKLVKG